jgi:hypothetical protein
MTSSLPGKSTGGEAERTRRRILGMEVERRIEQLVGRQLVLELPESFENHQVEIIVLTLETARRNGPA